jgi:hypothetical protein
MELVAAQVVEAREHLQLAARAAVAQVVISKNLQAHLEFQRQQ